MPTVSEAQGIPKRRFVLLLLLLLLLVVRMRVVWRLVQISLFELTYSLAFETLYIGQLRHDQVLLV